MPRYLVKLTPHYTYFFGGENTFGGKDGSGSNYLVKSNYFPQQTGLLGLVRYQLLVQNGLLTNNKIHDKAKAAQLIGAQSFTIGQPFNFEAIQSLSPIFIAGEDEKEKYLFPANKQYQWDDDKKEFVYRAYKNEGEIAQLEKYDAKAGLPDLLVPKKADQSTIKKYDDIFIPHEQVGIRKNYEGNTEDKAFYVQTFYRLQKGYSFAFILELADKLEGFNTIKFNSQNIVIFGGEQAAFKMEVDTFDEVYSDITPDYKSDEQSAKLVLLSDAYVEKDIAANWDFAIVEAVNFCCLTTKVNETEHYTRLSNNKTDTVTKSEKYNLYKKGSIFFGDTAAIAKKFKNDLLEKVGYNILKEVKQN